MQILIPSFVKSREGHFRGAKEPHAAPDPQLAGPCHSALAGF